MAKGLTADEFKDIIEELKRVLQEPQNASKLKRGLSWKLSIDNDTCHTAAHLHQSNVWLNADRLDLPPLSPDMNKVVEHVHAWLTLKMHSWLRSRIDNKPSVQECKQQLETFFHSYPTASIQKDVDSMKSTYEAIVHEAGMYPSSPFR